MTEIKNVNNITDKLYINRLDYTGVFAPYYEYNGVMKKYNFKPKDKEELQVLIKSLIKERGLKADLNDIDVSAISNINISELFKDTGSTVDISQWILYKN